MNKTDVNKIQILPDHIANQIAAGEVVQRPESVVKELVENSLDSGADEIAVIVKNAGKSLIHVIDNGTGMSKEDLKLSLKRHATSKIFEQKDLEAISSFGFRGEALASIASVAHLEIQSKQKGDEIAYKLIAEPNKEPKLEETSGNKGTQVLVRNLFYNVPARRKFLKANITEFKYISETMIKFALAHNDKRITFYDDNNLIFDLEPTDKSQRIVDTLGKVYDELLIPVENEEEGLKVSGYIGKPFLARQGYGNQYLYLNNRPVKSKYLNHAVYKCYEDMLEEKKYPFFALFMELDSDKVDVNVHPQKHEVKFENERLVYNVIKNSILSSLRANNLIPEFKIEAENEVRPFRIERDEEDDILVNKNTGEVISKKSDYDDFKQSRGGSSQFSGRKEFDKPFTEREEFNFGKIFGDEEEDDSLEYLNIDDRFILIKEQEHLLVVYKRRALQRIYFEKLLKSIKNNNIQSQEILFPIDVPIDSKQRSQLESIKDSLEKFGFKIDIIHDSAMVSSVPLIANESDIPEFFGRLLSNYHEIEEEDIDSEEHFSKAISISINTDKIDFNTKEKVQKFKEDLFSTENPYQNPMGKLTLYRIPYAELEKKFRN